MIALAGALHGEGVDLVLGEAVVSRALARIVHLDVRLEVGQQGGGDQVVGDDDVGLAQQAPTAQREQVRVARAGADQVDLSPVKFRGSL